MYIIIEGGDGTGKNSQADWLEGYLAQHTGKCITQVSEPDSESPTGRLLRQMLREGTYVKAHAAMFLADRMALLSTRVSDALAADHIVISVRSWMSTLAYQQEDWPLEWLFAIHQQLPVRATHLILLDMDPEVALERASRRPGPTEFYEKLDIQRRIRQRYLDLVPRAGELLAPDARVGVIDATGTLREVHTRITEWLK